MCGKGREEGLGVGGGVLGGGLSNKRWGGLLKVRAVFKVPLIRWKRSFKGGSGLLNVSYLLKMIGPLKVWGRSLNVMVVF